MRIELCEQSVVYLIAERSTGVTYRAQAAGMACAHPVIEGAVVAVAIGKSASDLADLMCELGCWQPHWDAARVASTNQVLAELPFECFTEVCNLQLDTDRLDESVEGWWRVTFELRAPLDGDVMTARGVLCGPNCD